jgi:hypothetical protein
MRLPSRRKPREDPPPTRCAATTRAGRPCRLPPAWPGCEFCLVHLPGPPVPAAS